MSTSKAKRKITYLLAGGTLTLWGIVIFRIISFITHDASISQDKYPDNIEFQNTRNVPFVRWDTVSVSSTLPRDPFQFRKPTTARTVERSTDKKDVSSPPSVNPFLFTISGIIVSEHDRLVILEDIEKNEQIFLRRNQKYKTVKIVEIQPDSVSILEGGKIRKIGVR